MRIFRAVTGCNSPLPIAALILTFFIAVATATPFEPVFNPVVTIQKSSQNVSIDGKLDLDEWAEAARIYHYVERHPNDNTEPEVRTETFVTYDQDHLYVAFVCYDDPALLRATMCQRDQFNGDDAVCVLLDTYGDAAWAYEFFVNPYGVQKDYLWSNVSGEDPGFDLLWESAAVVTDSGYQVEMALPFASMRFPSTDVQSWRIDFWRNRPRETFQQYSWAAYDRNERCWPCQWGTVEGISGVEVGRGVELLTSYVAQQAGALTNPGDPRSNFSDGDLAGEPSVGAKYTVGSDVTIEATYNPDFSQIESDAAQVDVNSTIALFFPERRPFFQEGADVFRTLFNSFHTRTVNDPQYAAKIISRKQGLTLGFMSALDENTPYMIPLQEESILFNAGRSYINVLRASTPVGESSQLGFLVSDRRFEDNGYGSIIAADGDISLTKSISFDGQFLASFTGEPDVAGASEGLDDVELDQGKYDATFNGESFSGNACIARLRRSARHLQFMAAYSQVEPDYRTESGYDPWVDYRDIAVWSAYTFYPETGPFQRIQPQAYTDARFRFDGVRRWESQSVGINMQLRWAQTSIDATVGRASQRWTSRLSDELLYYPDLYESHLNVYMKPTSQFGTRLDVNLARSVALFADAVGDQVSVNLAADYKPADRVVIEPSLSFVSSNHSDAGNELFRQLIFRTRLNVQVTREFSVRLVGQYNNSRAALLIGHEEDEPVYFGVSSKQWDVDPLISYQLSPFSVFYAGSTYDYSYFPQTQEFDRQWKLSSRQYFVKLQHLIRL